MEDEKLLIKAKKGDSPSFGQIYDKYAPRIYRYFFLKLGGKKGEAEDLTHEVFLSAWKSIETFDIRGVPFSSYLYRVARNAVIDYWRTKRPTLDIDVLPEELFSEDPDVGEKMDLDADMEMVKRRVASLDPVYQDVLIMKFVEDLSNREIADALDKSEGAIRVIQHRALKQLKKEIEKHESEFSKTTQEA